MVRVITDEELILCRNSNALEATHPTSHASALHRVLRFLCERFGTTKQCSSPRWSCQILARFCKCYAGIFGLRNSSVFTRSWARQELEVNGKMRTCFEHHSLTRLLPEGFLACDKHNLILLKMIFACRISQM